MATQRRIKEIFKKANEVSTTDAIKIISLIERGVNFDQIAKAVGVDESYVRALYEIREEVEAWLNEDEV